MADYAELCKRLRSQANLERYYHASGKVFDDAADAIEDLLAELVTLRNQLPKWVSVEERMPHYLDHVLCVNKFGIQMVGYLTDYKEGGFRCESGMDSCDYITNWMPLPEPPKEVRDA